MNTNSIYNRSYFYLRLSGFKRDNQPIERPNRELFFNEFSSMLNLQSLIVSNDDYDRNAVRIYAKFVKNINEGDVEALVKRLAECKIDYIRYVDESQCIKSISDRDKDMMYKGLLHSQLGKHWNRMQFFKECSENKSFNHNHPYIWEFERGRSKQLIKFYEAYLDRYSKPKDLYIIHNVYKGWQYEVVEWLNSWVTNSWTFKKSQLYLHGPNNSGKTKFIQYLLAHLSEQIYDPLQGRTNNKYKWEKFNSNRYNLVLADPFDFRKYEIGSWKMLTEGNDTKIAMRGKPGKTISIRCPFIMISNHAPLSFVQKEQHLGVLNRIKVVEASRFEDDEFEHIPIRYIAFQDDASRLYSYDEINELESSKKISFNIVNQMKTNNSHAISASLPKKRKLDDNDDGSSIASSETVNQSQSSIKIEVLDN